MILGVNRFFEWIGLKQELHQGTQARPLVSASDIWWASIGENVGFETPCTVATTPRARL
jgi:hypothetical protein